MSLVNKNAEWNLLSLVINSEDNFRAEILSQVEPEKFGDEEARVFAISMKDISDSGKSMDEALLISTVNGKNSGKFKSDEDIIIFYKALKQRKVKAEDVDYKDYIQVIENLFIRRSIISKVAEVQKKAQDETVPLDNLFLDFQNLTMFDRKEDFIISGEKIVKTRLTGLEERANAEATYGTGFQNIDDMLSYGFAPGQMSIIAARPRTGKSMLKSNIINNICLNGNAGIVNFCLEQSFQREMDRLSTMRKEIPLKQIIQLWKWGEDDQRIDQLVQDTYDISRKQLHFIDKRTMTTNEALNILNFLTRQSQIDVVFFDLFDRFLDINDPSVRNKTNMIAHKLSVLSEWSRILNVHFCLIAQINRQVEYAKSHRPKLGHLYGSDAFGQYCDLAILLHRDDMYKDEDDVDDDTTIEVIIEKQRDGMEGSAHFTWEPHILRLQERLSASGI